MAQIQSFLASLRAVFRERSLRGTLTGLLLSAGFLPLLVGYLVIGFKLSAVNFTYGARGLDPAVKPTLPLLFLYTLLGTYLIEALFRGLLLRSLLGYFSWQKAFWLHLAAANVFLGPFLFREGLKMESMGLFRFWLMENLLQSFWALFFLKTGSLVSTALLRGTYDFIRFVIINDVAGPFETLYFYSSASDDFYWLMLSMTFVAVGLQVLINRKWSLLEKGVDHADA